jgi:hypothetical protein
VTGLRGATLTVRFLCELGAIAALGYWGFHTGDGAAAFAFGFGAPAIAIAVWGVFVAPKAVRPVPLATRLVFEALVFGSAVAALVAAELPATAVALGVFALGSSVLNAFQERAERLP